jgi:hypothetical protein
VPLNTTDTREVVGFSGATVVESDDTLLNWNMVGSIFEYLGVANRNFFVEFAITTTATSIERETVFSFYKSTTANPNPPSGNQVVLSRVVQRLRNAVNGTSTISGNFLVNMVTSDTLKLYVRNNINNATVIVADARIFVLGL